MKTGSDPDGQRLKKGTRPGRAAGTGSNPEPAQRGSGLSSLPVPGQRQRSGYQDNRRGWYRQQKRREGRK